MAGSSWVAWGVPVIVIGSLVILFLLVLLLRWYSRSPMYHGTARIDGKTVVITGANTGIGKTTAIDLAKRGGNIIILCRNEGKGEAAAKEIRQASGSSAVRSEKLDLADLESVRGCAALLKETAPEIHILINNAGVVCPKRTTRDGFDMQFGTNHLGHFLLTLLLVGNLKAAAPSRIISVSSLGHIFGKMNWDDLNMEKCKYSATKAYCQSKLANVLFMKYLGEKLRGTQVSTYSLHPGAVQTEITRELDSISGRMVSSVARLAENIFYKNAVQGAQTSVYCAVEPTIAQGTGKYYSRCAPARPSKRARNMKDAERLWNGSLEMVGLQDFTF